MIKVSNKMLKEFLSIMDEYGEMCFGDKKYLKKQLETCLNYQGFWSANCIKIYWNTEKKEFYVENRWV